MSHGLKFYTQASADNHLTLIDPKISKNLRVQQSFNPKNPTPFQIVPKAEASVNKSRSRNAHNTRQNMLHR